MCRMTGESPYDAAHEFRLVPAAVRGFVRHLYAVSDGLAGLDIGSVLYQGAGACEGTDLVAGLRRHADEQHDHVQWLSQHWDRLGDSVKQAVDSFEQVDEVVGRPPRPL